MSMAYGNFHGGFQVFVAKAFQDPLSILSPLRECLGSGVFVVKAMMFVVMIVVDLAWSKSIKGWSRVLKGPVRLTSVFIFSTGGL